MKKTTLMFILFIGLASFSIAGQIDNTENFHQSDKGVIVG
ncbi:hypothetical protein J2S05_001661 [Alkalicoccobacillus murimartini]|uniref:Uncharacterized protein n=1 Tax=Alkalicoccobacillus murimartini TaxID=171685 RepID=A0ABT9YI33_9BACI|nr:hypothetical protein [Alkalicoccobacillus murimartini]